MSVVSNRNTGNVPQEIEELLVLFERTWGQPDSPNIEKLLDEISNENRSILFRELLFIEFDLTLRKTTELLLEQYVARFPEHEPIIWEVAHAVGQYSVYKHRSINGYTLLNEIGRGGMGVVYRAKHDWLHNYVAFKIVNQRMVNNPESLSRFKREMKMAGRLKHPNIVEATDAGVTDDGTPYLVMELVEGKTLCQLVKDTSLSASGVHLGELEPAALDSSPSFSDSLPIVNRESKRVSDARIVKACVIVHRVAQGLQAIHEAGLVHRDIKPGNIILLPDGQVKILDLGLAKLCDQIAEYNENTMDNAQRTLRGHFLGTPGYMAPEQVHSPSSVDIRADIYSLGCTFFYLLHGHAPSEQPVDEIQKSLPKKVHVILDRMLMVNPAARFQTPSEVVAALAPFVGTQRNNRWLGIFTAVSIAIFIGILVLVYDFWQDKPVIRPSEITDQEDVHLYNIKKERLIADIQEAVELRYRGENWNAEKRLLTLTNELRDLPPVFNLLFAEALSARGDCVFFSDFASGNSPENEINRMQDWYKEAADLTEQSSSESQNVWRTKLLCKLAVVTGNAELLPRDDNTPLHYLSFARAVIAAKGKNYQPLRTYVESFKVNKDMLHESLDLVGFASNRLKVSNDSDDQAAASEKLKALESLFEGTMK